MIKILITLVIICSLCSGCSSDVLTNNILGLNRDKLPKVITYDVNSSGETVQIVETYNGELRREIIK